MSNVFLKNTTSASITVAGHKVYYIDSTDAELVEVEGTSRQALPSVGDTVTFGNYPQATSTPEPIEWTVLAVDSTNGKALLIAKKVLDCQKYNSTSASVTWETCSLRTWLNSTFFNAAFDSTEQGRVPLSHVETSGQSATDDNIFCISEQDAANTEYFANADARKSLGTQKAIDAGAWTYNGYSVWWLRSAGSTSSRAMIISTVGGIDDTGYSVNDTSGGVRPALWLNYTSTVKYNAFKYTLNNTPYYYVIDGTHDTWTDDLSAWGYSEVQPVVGLPTVTISDKWLVLGADAGATSGGNVTIAANATRAGCWWNDGSGSYIASVYDSSVVYAVVRAAKTPWEVVARVGLPVENVGGSIGVRNSTGASISVYQAEYAYCDNLSATVVTVYNSSNVAYNAFKYTTNGTDYYYVLDGTQTDWVSDLAGIGYRNWVEKVYKNPDPYTSFYGSGGGEVRDLVDANNNKIPVDNISNMTITAITPPSGAPGYMWAWSLDIHNGFLAIRNVSGIDQMYIKTVTVRIQS